MKRYILGGLVPLLLGLAGCGKTDPVPYECIIWSNQYYMAHPVETLNPMAGGWLFRGVKDIHGALRAGFIVPEPLNTDEKRRKAGLRLICPRKSADIWRLLPEQNHYYVDVWTQDLKFRESYKCR